MHPLLKIHRTPNSLEVIEREPKGSGPLPTLVYFALSAKNSLTLDPFNQPVRFLLQENIRLLSITLPDHHEGEDPQIAMKKWAERLYSNPHFFDEYVGECKETLFSLIQQGIIDPEKIALAGLSRGGFTALRLSAEAEIFKTVLAFAPLVDLKSLSEFRDGLSDEVMENLSLKTLIPRLVGKNIRIQIGNRDTRVGTAPAYFFVEELVEHSFIEGIRSPPVELVLTPSIGHKGHGTSEDSFRRGALWLKNRLDSQKKENKKSG